MPALVRRRDEPLLGGQALGALPERRHLDAVDAIAPRIPLRERGLVLPVRKLQAVELAARALAHVREAGLHLRKHVPGQRTQEVRAQREVVFVLVPELGRLLRKRHATTLPPRGQGRQESETPHR